jgi:methane/ammonia monooxygenase subunit A
MTETSHHNGLGLGGRLMRGYLGRRPAVLDVAGLNDDAAKFSRIFDYLVLAAVITLFAGAIHLHVMLTAGDWDMFIDWKDRQYFYLIMPVSGVMLLAALQAIFWTHFRLPIGATVGAVLLFIATWITRKFVWMDWTNFPFSMIIPSTLIAGAIMMDCALMVLRNGLFTAVFGGFAFGFFFFPTNAAILAPYFLPIEHQGMVASLADMVGYTYPRSAMPEYLRHIERGTLRTFGSGVSWVSAAFAGFICIFSHMIWWLIGNWASQTTFVRNGKWFQRQVGLAPQDPPKIDA